MRSTHSRAKLGKDPLEIRRLNFLREFPSTITSGLTVDSGDYDAHLDAALEILDHDDIRRQQSERRERGDTKQLGIGFSTYLEMCGIAPSRVLGAIRYGAGGWDAATIRFLPTGTVQVLIGVSPHGQSHVTTFSQIVAERLGIPYEDVEVLHGDTAVAPLGMDTYGSRSLTVGGVAAYHAAERVVEKARKIAAHQLEVGEDELEYENGTFTVNGKSLTTKELALQAWTAHNLPDGMEPGLEASFVYDPPNFSWPSGTHIAVVEVDTEIGDVDLIRYIAVDDVGNGDQPDGRCGPDPRRHRAGRRAGAVGGGGLRRGRQPRHRLDGELPGALGGRAALVRARSDGRLRARRIRSARRGWGRRAPSPRPRP